MARVVPDQKSKFDSDELFRKLSRESETKASGEWYSEEKVFSRPFSVVKDEIRYTNYRDRTHEERVVRFQSECREGRCPISFSQSGTNLLLYLGPQLKDKKSEQPTKEYLDFDKEPGKVHIKSQFVMNGVCVIMKGVVDLQRLDGTGYLELDVIQAKIEDKILRETIEQSRMRLQEFEERQRRVKQEPLEASEAPYTNAEYHAAMSFGNY